MIPEHQPALCPCDAAVGPGRQKPAGLICHSGRLALPRHWTVTPEIGSGRGKPRRPVQGQFPPVPGRQPNPFVLAPMAVPGGRSFLRGLPHRGAQGAKTPVTIAISGNRACPFAVNGFILVSQNPTNGRSFGNRRTNFRIIPAVLAR